MRVKFTLHAHEVLSGFSPDIADSIRSAIRAIGKISNEFHHIYEGRGNKTTPATAIEAAGSDFYFVYQPGTNPLYVTRVGTISELSLALRAQLSVHQNVNMFDGSYVAQINQQVVVANATSTKNTADFAPSYKDMRTVERLKLSARAHNSESALYHRIQQVSATEQAEEPVDPKVVCARIQKILNRMQVRHSALTTEVEPINFYVLRHGKD